MNYEKLMLNLTRETEASTLCSVKIQRPVRGREARHEVSAAQLAGFVPGVSAKRKRVFGRRVSRVQFSRASPGQSDGCCQIPPCTGLIE